MTLYDNETELLDKLSAIINNNDKLQQFASDAFDCGKRHHNKSDIDNMLKNDLSLLVE